MSCMWKCGLRKVKHRYCSEVAWIRGRYTNSVALIKWKSTKKAIKNMQGTDASLKETMGTKNNETQEEMASLNKFSLTMYMWATLLEERVQATWCNSCRIQGTEMHNAGTLLLLQKAWVVRHRTTSPLPCLLPPSKISRMQYSVQEEPRNYKGISKDRRILGQ